MLERKTNAKILNLPTSNTCHRQKILALQANAKDPYCFSPLYLVFLLSSILSILPDKYVPLCGQSMSLCALVWTNQCSQVLESHMSPEYMAQDPQAVSGRPDFVLKVHIRKHRQDEKFQ